MYTTEQVIVFLKATGVRKSEEMIAVLYIAAADLLVSGRKREDIRHPDFEGTLRAVREHSILGSFSGPEFAAEIDSDGGKFIGSFIALDEPDMLRACGEALLVQLEFMDQPGFSPGPDMVQ